MTEKKPFTLVVAKDGTGDYSTVTEALAALGEEGEPALIYIKKGVYKERLTIRRPFVTFEGEDMNETVITYNLGAKMEMEDGSRRGTFRSYSVLIDTHDFTARNLTFENSAGLGALVGQALALYVDGDRTPFLQVPFRQRKSNQTVLSAPSSMPPGSMAVIITRTALSGEILILFLEAPRHILKTVSCIPRILAGRLTDM